MTHTHTHTHTHTYIYIYINEMDKYNKCVIIAGDDGGTQTRAV